MKRNWKNIRCRGANASPGELAPFKIEHPDAAVRPSADAARRRKAGNSLFKTFADGARGRGFSLFGEGTAFNTDKSQFLGIQHDFRAGSAVQSLSAFRNGRQRLQGLQFIRARGDLKKSGNQRLSEWASGVFINFRGRILIARLRGTSEKANSTGMAGATRLEPPGARICSGRFGFVLRLIRFTFDRRFSANYKHFVCHI